MSPSTDLAPPEIPEAGPSESPRKRKKRLERERKQRQQAQEAEVTEQPADETPAEDITDNPSARQSREGSPADDDDQPLPPQPARRSVGGKSVPGTRSSALPGRGRGKGKGRQSTSRRQQANVLDDDDEAEGIICRIPCLRCAKSSWVASEDGEPVGPQVCRRPRAGLKCIRCTKLHKYCLPIPGPFEAEITAIRHPADDDDTDLVAATRSWTQRVQTFIRKANTEPVLERTLRSLLHHTFELRNDIRAAWRIGQRLPPSAMIIWPVMDGTEKEDEPDRGAGTVNPRLLGPNDFDDLLNTQAADDYGQTLFP